MKQHQKKSGKSNASFGQRHIIQELSKLQVLILLLIYFILNTIASFYQNYKMLVSFEYLKLEVA